MGCPPVPLPALCVAPVPVEAGPEVADAAAGVSGWVVHPGPVEHASYPLPVVGRVVAHEDRMAVAEVLSEPGRKTLSDFLVSRYALAGDADRRVVRVRRRVEQASVERVTRVVVNGPELSQHAVHRTDAACLAIDEYQRCLLAHPVRITPKICRAVSGYGAPRGSVRRAPPEAARPVPRKTGTRK